MVESVGGFVILLIMMILSHGYSCFSTRIPGKPIGFMSRKIRFWTQGKSKKYLFPRKMLLITSLLILWLKLSLASCPSQQNCLGYLMRTGCDMH